MKTFFFYIYPIKCLQCPFRVKNILEWKRIIFKGKRTVKGEKKRWRGNGVMLRNDFGVVILSELVFFFSFFEGYKVSFANIFWICPF